MQAAAATVVCQPGSDEEQTIPRPFGFPPASFLVGEGEHLHPGEQLAGERVDGALDFVLREVLQWQVREPGVSGIADAVFAAGSAAVPQFEVGELSACGVGGELGDAAPVEVGWTQLCAGVQGRSLRTITRMPFGQQRRSSRSAASTTQAPS